MSISKYSTTTTSTTPAGSMHTVFHSTSPIDAEIADAYHQYVQQRVSMILPFHDWVAASTIAASPSVDDASCECSIRIVSDTIPF